MTQVVNFGRAVGEAACRISTVPIYGCGIHVWGESDADSRMCSLTRNWRMTIAADMYKGTTPASPLKSRWIDSSRGLDLDMAVLLSFGCFSLDMAGNSVASDFKGIEDGRARDGRLCRDWFVAELDHLAMRGSYLRRRSSSAGDKWALDPAFVRLRQRCA